MHAVNVNVCRQLAYLRDSVIAGETCRPWLGIQATSAVTQIQEACASVANEIKDCN